MELVHKAVTAQFHIRVKWIDTTWEIFYGRKIKLIKKFKINVFPKDILYWEYWNSAISYIPVRLSMVISTKIYLGHSLTHSLHLTTYINTRLDKQHLVNSIKAYVQYHRIWFNMRFICVVLIFGINIQTCTSIFYEFNESSIMFSLLWYGIFLTHSYFSE